MRKLTNLYVLISSTLVIMTGVYYLNNKSLHEQGLHLTKAAERKLDLSVHCSGEIEAPTIYSLNLDTEESPSKILEMVSNGQVVKQGDVLLRFDSSELEKDLKSIQAQLTKKEKEIARLEENLQEEKMQNIRNEKLANFELQEREKSLLKLEKGEGILKGLKLRHNLEKTKKEYEKQIAQYEEACALYEEAYLNGKELENAAVCLEGKKEAFCDAQEAFDHYFTIHSQRVEEERSQLSWHQVNVLKNQEGSRLRLAIAEDVLKQTRIECTDLQRAMSLAQAQIEETIFRAPSEGIVVLSENQKKLRIVDASKRTIKARLTKDTMNDLPLGIYVGVEVAEHPYVQYDASLKEINIKEGMDTVFVSIAIDDERPDLYPGMKAKMTIQSHSIEQALTVPKHAIVSCDGNDFICLPKRRGYCLQAITLGHSNDQWAEVVSGLENGQAVFIDMPDSEEKIQRKIRKTVRG